MAKRARSYAPSWPRKRARIARYAKRRSYARRARSNYVSGQKGNAVSTMFRAKRLPYRVWKRKLYQSLMFKESYRSISSAPGNAGFTHSDLGKKQWFSQTLPSDFYTVAGGLTSTDATFTNDKFIIKGGMLSVALVNNDASPIIIEWGAVRYYNDDYTINATETEYVADISFFDGFGYSFKLIQRMKRVVLEPGDRIDMRVKIPFTIINNIQQYENQNKGKVGLIYTIQANSVAAESFPRVISHNLTFVADAVTANTVEN